MHAVEDFAAISVEGRPLARVHEVVIVLTGRGTVSSGSMLGNEHRDQNCSLARTLESVGERWTLLIVRELMIRPRRFFELERRLLIAKNILVARLGKLVTNDIVEALPVEDTKGWKIYQLTPKGRDLFPLISAMIAWGDRYNAPHGPPVVLVHSCGHPSGHKLVCANCGESIDSESVRVVPGPGWTVPAADDPGQAR